VLVYLLNAGPQLLSRELVSAQELKTAHFFQGPHELNVRGVLERFGRDLKGFRKAAESWRGSAELGEAAFKIPRSPRFSVLSPVGRDDEFEPGFPCSLTVPSRAICRRMPYGACRARFRSAAQDPQPFLLALFARPTLSCDRTAHWPDTLCFSL